MEQAQAQPTSWQQFLASSLDKKAELLLVPPSREKGKKPVASKESAIDWDKAMKGIPPPRLIPIESSVLRTTEWEAALNKNLDLVDVLPSPLWTGMDALLKPIIIKEQLPPQ
ncbi:UNVERIFIED_CONTAM: hypothetical protein HDU68_008832 [Siphonaria sp. JEL0065]|nr:hypothetical protein HDU68_008832 [Siphonaria sp. JEL0065]